MALSLNQLLPCFKQFQLGYVALRLGIPSALATGPKTLAELASQLNLPEQRFLRLMRGLVWAEVVSFDQTHGFSLTTEACRLLDPSPTSEVAGILFQGQFFYSAWGCLYEYLWDEKIPFEQVHGKRLFALLSNEPVLAGEFNRPMSARTAEYSHAIAVLPALCGPKKIVDVGGGEGRLLLDVLKVCPSSTGVILDISVVRAEAERMIRESGLTDRCRFREGDMFSSVPEGGDVYILKWVLHDWDDQSALKILQVIRSKMRSEASLVIIERIMPDGINEALPLVQADLNMLILNGGAERTRTEYEKLLMLSGFKLCDVTPVESNYGFYALTAMSKAE
jgi:hypothetical protein